LSLPEFSACLKNLWILEASDYCCSLFVSCTHAKLEGTHRVRTHTELLLILTLTLTFDLSTENRVTCRISHGHSLYQVWTLWDYSFLNNAADISFNPNPNLDLWPFNPKPYHLQDTPRSFPISSLLRTNRQSETDRQTNKRTDGLENPTQADRQSVWVISCAADMLCLVTFDLLTLKLVRIIAYGVDNLTNFGVYGTCVLDLWAYIWDTSNQGAIQIFNVRQSWCARYW